MLLDPDGENLVNGYISSISKKDDFTLLKIEDIKKLPISNTSVL